MNQKVMAFCLSDITYISRFHRNYKTLSEMGFKVYICSLKPRGKRPECLSDNHYLVDGRLRRLRHPIFAPLRHIELIFKFFVHIYKSEASILFAHNLPALAIGWLVKKVKQTQVEILVYDSMELEAFRASHSQPYLFLHAIVKNKIKFERFLAKEANIIISADHARTNIMTKLN